MIRKLNFKCRLMCIGITLIVMLFADRASELMAANAVENERNVETTQLIELNQSVEKTLELERQGLQELNGRLAQIELADKKFAAEINTYKLQQSAQNNLLLYPGTEPNTLEKALGFQKIAIESISNKLAKLNKELKDWRNLYKKTEDDLVLANKETTQIGAAAAQSPERQKLLETIKAYIEFLPQKLNVIDRLATRQARVVEQLTEIKQEFETLTGSFKQRIKAKNEAALFQKRINPILRLEWHRIAEDAHTFLVQVRLITSRQFWTTELQPLWQSNRLLIFFSFFILVIVGVAAWQLQRYLYSLEARPFFQQATWRLMGLRVFNRSTILFLITVFTYAYAQEEMLYLALPVIRLLIRVSFILIITRWLRDFIRVWNQIHPRPIPGPLTASVKRMISVVRPFAIFYEIGTWLVSSPNSILLLFRVVFELYMLFWCIHFWKSAKHNDTMEKGAVSSRSKILLEALTYLIVIMGLLTELAGYWSLAQKWYFAWAISGTVLLWGALGFGILRELERDYQRKNEDAELTGQVSNPLTWLVIRIGWLVLSCLIFLAVIIVWSGRQTVVANIIDTLRQPVTIGKMSFSIFGLLYAFVVLFLTQALARVWRFTMTHKILSDSHLDQGLQDSITTISVYMLWAFGILLSLHVVGFGTESMVLIIGALGIGLGFGLQNIFNNFISGIILLFERPIQVGDDIEINGAWATVKKINVRATVVHTYDNAALIIPNSEFISSVVKNWSFRDKRLRRDIDVGVAYGSDVERVRQLLLEIADKTSKVSKYPNPDVLFQDFGDNSLNFRLRVWTDIDNMLKVPTAIRFEIDRIFRENGIEIAFPQRDIHIRSVTEGAKNQLKSEVER